METIKLNGFNYKVKPDEFVIQPHQEYNNLRIYPKVGNLERIIGLLNDLTENTKNTSISIYGWSHGGFVPVGCSKIYESVHVFTNDNLCETYNLPNIKLNQPNDNPFAIYVDNVNVDISNYTQSYILANTNQQINKNNFKQFELNNSDLILSVPIYKLEEFNETFHYYLNEDGKLDYDNLIHLCIMVKNAGPLFEKVLTENLPIIDRWTILDTGSTDGTQDIIRRVLADKKKGNLYEEPFINFRESRNRCLNLAGKHCKYLVMLDDTYALRNDLRKFLNVVRGDQFASSYSLLILSDDTEYYSNRVTMSEKGLRYIYTIHEVIQHDNNKENVVIPKDAAYIHDHRADYMEKRTMDRKRYDLELLHGMVKEDPTNPRHYYYLAQTYNLLEDYENALYWFKRRATSELEGHLQEAVDSWFEYARICNFKLNRPWEECKHAYEECYKMDKTRPEALYFLGIHYYLENDKEPAFDYFKQAFALGYPIHAQFSLKPTLVFHFLPKFLAELSWYFKDWKLGFEASLRFLENNKPGSDYYDVMLSWFNIFNLLCKIPIPANKMHSIPEKPLVIFVADGGWGSWTGSDILTKGVGGSETYIIEIARWIQAKGIYDCIVFCKCSKPEVFEGVRYMSLDDYPKFISCTQINTIVVSRFSEYIPLSYQAAVENVYLVLHDLGPSGLVIPQDNKLKKILCLTDWHKELFSNSFSSLKPLAESFYYGIDNTKFVPTNKIKNSFIYSSFPNRGLLPLLQMWPKIKTAIPDATLNVYADVNGKWVNEVAKDQMDQIRQIIKNGLNGVNIHGWVSKKDLAEAWSKADIWFYPCIFQETFCLTALEAAATKTLAISTPLAALNETVGDRGVLIPGNPLEREWQEKALKEILSIISNDTLKNELIEKNYKWAQNSSWKQRGEEFMNKYLNSTISEINIPTIKNNTNTVLFRQLQKINPRDILDIGSKTIDFALQLSRWFTFAKIICISNKIIDSNKNNSINIIKDSQNTLIDYIKLNKYFDCISVNYDDNDLDYYNEIMLATNLVKFGGIIVLNNISVISQNVIKQIIDNFKDKYELILDINQVIIRKR